MSRIQFVHLRARNNGIPQDFGGYTVALKKRTDDKWNVSICQCNTKQRYNERLGEKVAEQRISRGQFFVQDDKELKDTLGTLHTKLCTGSVPALNTSDIFESALQPA